MSEAYKVILQLPVQDMLSGNFGAKLVETEKEYRDRIRTEMYLKTSELRYNTLLLEDIISPLDRKLTKELLFSLFDCNFTGRAQKLLINGKAGSGHYIFVLFVDVKESCSFQVIGTYQELMFSQNTSAPRGKYGYFVKKIFGRLQGMKYFGTVHHFV